MGNANNIINAITPRYKIVFDEFILREKFIQFQRKSKMSVFVLRVVDTNVLKKKESMIDRQRKIITHD
jgi:hypothetical protein